MKKSIFIFIGVIVANVCLAQYDPKALEILEAMSKKYKTIASFEANLTSTLVNQCRLSVGSASTETGTGVSVLGSM